VNVRGIVAIVEYDLHISRALGMWLELQSLSATCHASGESLLHALHQDDGHLTLHDGAPPSDAFRLIGAVLDLNLPGISGVELANALRCMAPELPVAIITALRDDERVGYGTLPPGIRCLMKPFDLDALEEALFPLLADFP
jgi:DNA-binding response OmpR family regulator